MKTEVRIINKKYLYVRSYSLFTLKDLKELGDDGFNFNIASFNTENEVIEFSSLSFIISKFWVCDCNCTTMKLGNFYIDIEGNVVKITHEYITKIKRNFYTKGFSFRDEEIRKLFEGGDEEDSDFKISIRVKVKPQQLLEDEIKITIPKEYKKELENGVEDEEEF